MPVLRPATRTPMWPKPEPSHGIATNGPGHTIALAKRISHVHVSIKPGSGQRTKRGRVHMRGHIDNDNRKHHARRPGKTGTTGSIIEPGKDLHQP